MAGADGVLETRDVRIVDGRIAPAGAGALPHDDVEVIDATGCLVLPGFVNMHSHSYGTLCRHDGARLPLEPWMNYALAGTANRTPDEILVATQLQAIEALRTGTTAVVDHIGGAVAGLAPVLGAYEDSGIRAAVAPMIGDIPLPDSVGLSAEDWPPGTGYGAPEFAQKPAAELLDDTLALRRSWTSPSGRVAVILGPSAPQRCSTDLLASVAEAAEREDMLVHTHLLETRLQAALTPRSGVAPGWTSWTERGS
ncbi:amidohydrolase family protein [Naasia aerilata]|uniref:amidohydrolase family protein n=1 Tax=Naasia aerilata TaxID=1162966 RepID=UPI0025730BAA|nr:amidohydrolase family protein [Naasia aerilata]